MIQETIKQSCTTVELFLKTTPRMRCAETWQIYIVTIEYQGSDCARVEIQAGNSPGKMTKKPFTSLLR